MPETFYSEFFPKVIEEIVTYIPEPEPEPEPMPMPEPQYQQQYVPPPPVEQPIEPAPSIQQMVEPEAPIQPKVEKKPEPKKQEPKKQAAPLPENVFDILGSGEEKSGGEDIFSAPMKPAVVDKEPPKKETPISKLNEIMAKMQHEEQEERQKKENEEKMKQEMTYGTAFQPQPMMGPAWMQYATGMGGMPGQRPMGFPQGPFATNMPFGGGMPQMGNPMFVPPMPFPMGMGRAIPQVIFLTNNVKIADKNTSSSCT